MTTVSAISMMYLFLLMALSLLLRGWLEMEMTRASSRSMAAWISVGSSLYIFLARTMMTGIWRFRRSCNTSFSSFVWKPLMMQLSFGMLVAQSKLLRMSRLVVLLEQRKAVFLRFSKSMFPIWDSIFAIGYWIICDTANLRLISWKSKNIEDNLQIFRI